MNQKVWQASGHVDTFTDPLVECSNCKARFRADKIDTSKCPTCGKEGTFGEPRQFNMMFKTNVGPVDDESSISYLRPETAQGIFTNFKNVVDTFYPDLPFGIAQQGKAFRNEITPGNFIFRTREFDQMEIEYFCKPADAPVAFETWLTEMKSWVTDVLKLKDENVVYHEIPAEERAFCSARTVDIEYHYPFGQKELYGIANRTDYDLSRHQEYSKEDLRWLDPETNEKILPFVVEPTWGLDRSVLAVLCEHLDIDEAETTEEGEKEPRMVLRLPPL
jgi:glycyl-tRNA synthetase